MDNAINFLLDTARLNPVRQLLAAFVFGQLLAWTYELTYQGLSYSRSFAQTLVLSCISAATVVLAMGHSIVAGLGLLGVLSMVRFRTTLKSSRDLVFIMGSATIGVSSGVDAIGVAALGAVGFCVVVLYLHAGAFGSRERFDGVLRFRLAPEADVQPQLADVLSKHCRNHVMLSMGEIATGGPVEHAYQIKFWCDADREALVFDLRSRLQAGNVVLLLQETGLEY